MSAGRHAGAMAGEKKSRLAAHRWLLLRRTCQFTLLALFLSGPLTGFWIFKGNLAASRFLDTVPLTDPFILLQSLAAGTVVGGTAFGGALLIAGFYLVMGGRAYCSWVCPLNPVTDLAAWLRRRLNLREGSPLNRNSRYWLIAMVLLVSAVTGSLAWEVVNPVTMLHRGLIFGLGLAWTLPLAIFFFDLLVSKHGWCGHLCPVGGFYSLLGRFSLIRVRADGRENCSNCLECYAVCPEPQVIGPALKGENDQAAVITAANCTNCGRCIDVCAERVFSFGSRL
ncbi:quinol dehydrogenase ferredoxin subunit NapH [Thiovibrio sp. JS02]